MVFLQCFFMPLGVLVVQKTLKDEWYVVIKAYKFAIFEILRDFFFVLPYIACLQYLRKVLFWQFIKALFPEIRVAKTLYLVFMLVHTYQSISPFKVLFESH